MVVRNFSLLPNAPSIINRELFHNCLHDVESHLAYVRCQTTTMPYLIITLESATSPADTLFKVHKPSAFRIMILGFTLRPTSLCTGRLRVFTSVLVSGFNEDFWSNSPVLQLPTLPRLISCY